jgi:hypothetical protein
LIKKSKKYRSPLSAFLNIEKVELNGDLRYQAAVNDAVEKIRASDTNRLKNDPPETFSFYLHTTHNRERWYVRACKRDKRLNLSVRSHQFDEEGPIEVQTGKTRHRVVQAVRLIGGNVVIGKGKDRVIIPERLYQKTLLCVARAMNGEVGEGGRSVKKIPNAAKT